MMTREIPPRPVVLVVDDEALIRWSLTERMTEEGYAVRQASSGHEARAVMASLHGAPVIVVLDLRLPDVADLSLFREIRAGHPEAQIIVLTAHGSPEDEQTALSEGAFGFISKPFDLATIATMIEEARQSA